MPSPTPTPTTALPDFESLHTSFHALVTSLVPPSFVGVSRPQLDVEAIKKHERDRRDTERRKREEREREAKGGLEGSSSKFSSISTFPQMSESSKRKISYMRSSTNATAGPSTGDHRSAVNDDSSEDEGESRSSVVKSKRIQLASKGKKNVTSQSLADVSSEQKEIRNPFKLGEAFQPTSPLFTIDNTPGSSPNELPPAPGTPTVIPPTSPLAANPPSTPPRRTGGGSLPTSVTSTLTSTPSSSLSKNQRKKMRKREKRALEVAQTLQDVVGYEYRLGDFLRGGD